MNRARPPWSLSGYCIMIFYLVPARRAEELVPSPLEVSEVVPGATLGGLYAALYQTGEVGPFSEFSAFPALVRYGKRRGFYAPFSMVESLDDLPGYRGAWGLRKECASFEWREDGGHYGLDVLCGTQKIVSIQLSSHRLTLPIRVSFPFFHVRSRGVVSYHADYAARVHLSSSSVDIPAESPLTEYGLKRKLMTTLWESTKILLHPPESEKNIVIQEGASEGIFRVGALPTDLGREPNSVENPPSVFAAQREKRRKPVVV
ncbi:MAG: acetoacetate decarboxylase family protein [Deltaproteobacteria bacterium]|nr:acetoacetate decarboxylase family protein [Deltaproteobacteria bacterium]